MTVSDPSVNKGCARVGSVPYRHVQRAPATYLISVFGVVGLAWGVAVRDDFGGGFWFFQVVMLLVLVIGLVVARLTVVVDARAVTASFGWGWPRRSIERSEIETAVQVRNSWWHGWGIRKVSRGWMYNNAGRDAIELSLRSGRVFRIGTDEPAELLAAITR